MNRIINFGKYQVPKSARRESVVTSSCCDTIDSTNDFIEVDAAFRITLELLSQNNPNKTLFSLDEAAKQLTVGNEFIRRRIKAGKIKATYLGDKPLINIVELARIITEGV